MRLQNLKVMTNGPVELVSGHAHINSRYKEAMDGPGPSLSLNQLHLSLFSMSCLYVFPPPLLGSSGLTFHSNLLWWSSSSRDVLSCKPSFFGYPANEVLLHFHNSPSSTISPPSPSDSRLWPPLTWSTVSCSLPRLPSGCFQLQLWSCRCPLSRQLQAASFISFWARRVSQREEISFHLSWFISSFYLCLILN